MITNMSLIVPAKGNTERLGCSITKTKQNRQKTTTKGRPNALKVTSLSVVCSQTSSYVFIFIRKEEKRAYYIQTVTSQTLQNTQF